MKSGAEEAVLHCLFGFIAIVEHTACYEIK